MSKIKKQDKKNYSKSPKHDDSFFPNMFIIRNILTLSLLFSVDSKSKYCGKGAAQQTTASNASNCELFYKIRHHVIYTHMHINSFFCHIKQVDQQFYHTRNSNLIFSNKFLNIVMHDQTVHTIQNVHKATFVRQCTYLRPVAWILHLISLTIKTVKTF